MLRFLLVILAFAIGIPSASASSDSTCYPQWRLSNGERSCESSAVISPGNDTRANLLLLLDDKRSGGGTSYPELDWEKTYGRNFFNWQLLRGALYPSKGDGAPVGNDYYGTRCMSFASGSNAFNVAVSANKSVSAKDGKLLTEMREFIKDVCEGKDYFGGPPDDLIEILSNAESVLGGLKLGSKAAAEYLIYLQGASAFYGGDFGSAQTHFRSLAKSKDRWLKETATYMVARVHLNAAQEISFGKWGEFKGAASTNMREADLAEKAFTSYLASYPSGRYATSAQGLTRRIYWLRQDQARLSREYQRLLEQSGGSGSTADLVEEIDNKLLFVKGSSGQITEPLLLATIDLLRMRDDKYADKKTITLAELEKQKDAFSGRPELYDFLLANHAFYFENDAKKVLQLIPDAARQENFSYLQFSRQALRGTALQMLKDRNEGGFWRDMLDGSKSLYQRPAIEMGLASFYERNGQLGKVFAAASPIKDSNVREKLLQNVVGPRLLRSVAKDNTNPRHERNVALFTLLHKQLTHADYAGFLVSQKLIPAGANTDAGLWGLPEQEQIPVGLFGDGAQKGDYDCPSLRATVGMLSRSPKNARGRLCLGDFLLANDFDGFDPVMRRGYARTGSRPTSPMLGSSKSRFPGSAIPRQRLYKDIIAGGIAKPDERAYALYRAIRCYATTGHNSCGGVDVKKAQRKAWFQKLKRGYPNSKWAKKLKYYW